MHELDEVRVAFLATDGFEDLELLSPWEVLKSGGAEIRMVAPHGDTVVGKDGHSQRVDVMSENANGAHFDALVIPGGVENADHLRLDSPSRDFAASFFEQHKPVGVICHGAWILVEADVLHGRTMTSAPSLRTDLENAGANWVDRAVVVDETLVSSRSVEDLPNFNEALFEHFRSEPLLGRTL